MTFVLQIWFGKNENFRKMKEAFFTYRKASFSYLKSSFVFAGNTVQKIELSYGEANAKE